MFFEEFVSANIPMANFVFTNNDVSELIYATFGLYEPVLKAMDGIGVSSSFVQDDATVITKAISVIRYNVDFIPLLNK
jgi:hypothetical protein